MTPPILTGDAINQLTQIRSYLYQMTEQLNMASVQLDEKVIEVSNASSSSSSSDAKSVLDSKAEEYNALRSLIVKTADYTNEQITIVNNLIGDAEQKIVIVDGKVVSVTERVDGAEAEIDNVNGRVDDANSLITNTADYTGSMMAEIRTQVESNTDNISGLSASVSREYVAKSEYGIWQEDVKNQLAINADSITQTLSYLSNLEANVEAANSSFNNYVVATEGSIKMGIVEWSEDGTTPIIGIAIGQDITYREVTIGNETYAEIDKNKFLATFTSKALKFWQGEQLVAYITNNELYITNTRIIGSLGMGDVFSIRADSNVGFVVEYIGE